VIASARRFSRMVNVLSLTPAVGLLSYVCFVKWKMHRATHRAITPDDQYFIRTMDGSTPSLLENPGIRIESDFLSPEEQQKLRFESKMMLSLYGYSTIPFWTRPNWNKQIAGLLSKTRVNAIKITGRDPKQIISDPPMTDHARSLREEQEAALVKTKPYEANEPSQAPWKWADSFDLNAMPKVYRDLIDKIKALPGYKLGAVRDFSIDYRDDRYFKFDPHITPGLDGQVVFLLTLESDGVITLIPPEKQVFRRVSTDDISRYSFTDKDLDILHRRGDLLSLCDDARQTMDWSVRLGVDAKTRNLQQIVRNKYVSRNMQDDGDRNEDVSLESERYDTDDATMIAESSVVGNEEIVQDMDAERDEHVLCDWWGTSSQLIPRNHEKLLITLTFARAT